MPDEGEESMAMGFIPTRRELLKLTEANAAAIETLRGDLESLRERVEVIEESTPEAPARDISYWVDAFDDIRSSFPSWHTLSEGYSTLARVAMDAHVDMYSATGNVFHRDEALDLCLELIAAYGTKGGNRQVDMLIASRMGRVFAATSDTRITDHLAAILQRYDDVAVQGDGPGTSVTFKTWTQNQHTYAFQRSPNPQGAWQGFQTWAWLIAGTGSVDATWASAMASAWTAELNGGTTWGAGWEADDRYDNARGALKAGREVALVDLSVDEATFLAAWDRIYKGSTNGVPRFASHVDGYTQPNDYYNPGQPYHEGLWLWEGWHRLGQYSAEVRTVCDEVITGVLSNRSGSVFSLNRHATGVYQAALVAGRARAEIEYS